MGPQLSAYRTPLPYPAVSPASDPGFSTNKIHGEVAQLELLRQVTKLCKNKRVAVDVGAHIGLWSRNLALQFEYVFAFEPIIENIECFRKNTEGLKNVYLGEFALGSVERSVSMYLAPGANSGMWHVASDSVSETPNVRVLDGANLNALDLMKIDTEGYEGHVIRGAYETIKRCKPLIVFEENGLGPKYFGEAWVDPKPILRELGYRPRFNWRKDQVWMPV